MTENNQEILEEHKASQSSILLTNKALRRPKEKKHVDIPDSQCDISSGQKDTTAEVSGQYLGKLYCLSLCVEFYWPP